MVSSRNQSLRLLVFFLYGICSDDLLLRENITRNKACEKVISTDKTASSHNKELVPGVSKNPQISTLSR
jgi:hypothetical protein